MNCEEQKATSWTLNPWLFGKEPYTGVPHNTEQFWEQVENLKSKPHRNSSINSINLQIKVTELGRPFSYRHSTHQEKFGKPKLSDSRRIVVDN